MEVLETVTRPTQEFLAQMPKVELHVHLEGSIRPETLLALAQRNRVPLPVDSVEGLRDWYSFRDFPHFATVYWTLSESIRRPEDIELVVRDFLQGQADQNVLHTEFTYTALTIFRRCGIAWADQVEALTAGREWARRELGVTSAVVVDLPREDCTEEESLMVADWVIDRYGRGVDAFGLGGYEVGFPPHLFKRAFDRVRSAGVPSVPHAGETEGPASVWGALRDLGAARIGHGVRSLEDPGLVSFLADHQVPLEVCPSSNVCLKVFDAMADHPLPRMLEAGLNVTLNSDDPPMFDTSLTTEWQRAVDSFGLDLATVRSMTENAVAAALVDEERRRELAEAVRTAFTA